jgi:hypothetical protein
MVNRKTQKRTKSRRVNGRRVKGRRDKGIRSRRGGDGNEELKSKKEVTAEKELTAEEEYYLRQIRREEEEYRYMNETQTENKDKDSQCKKYNLNFVNKVSNLKDIYKDCCPAGGFFSGKQDTEFCIKTKDKLTENSYNSFYSDNKIPHEQRKTNAKAQHGEEVNVRKSRQITEAIARAKAEAEAEAKAKEAKQAKRNKATLNTQQAAQPTTQAYVEPQSEPQAYVEPQSTTQEGPKYDPRAAWINTVRSNSTPIRPSSSLPPPKNYAEEQERKRQEQEEIRQKEIRRQIDLKAKEYEQFKAKEQVEQNSNIDDDLPPLAPLQIIGRGGKRRTNKRRTNKRDTKKR